MCTAWMKKRRICSERPDMELGGGFRRVLRFPPPVTNGYSRLSRNMAEELTKKNEIPNFKMSLVSGGRNQSDRQKPPPNPKSLAKVLHAPPAGKYHNPPS